MLTFNFSILSFPGDWQSIYFVSLLLIFVLLFSRKRKSLWKQLFFDLWRQKPQSTKEERHHKRTFLHSIFSEVYFAVFRLKYLVRVLGQNVGVQKKQRICQNYFLQEENSRSDEGFSESTISWLFPPPLIRFPLPNRLWGKLLERSSSWSSWVS